MRLLLDSSTIARRVAELGETITETCQDRDLTILAVLNGSLIFLADLVRMVRIPHRIGLIQASSYRGTATQPGSLTINDALLPDIRNRHVLLLDDIFDTGHTTAGLIEKLRPHEPASLTSCVLLWKTARRQVTIKPDHFGFEIPDEFVVGYGLDYNDDYRHLPHIAVLEESDLS